MVPPSWLPGLVLYNDYGDYRLYIEALYGIYRTDFIQNPFRFDGKTIRVRREPPLRNKDKAFWHICGEDTGQAAWIDFRRHERIRWPKAIILHHDDATVKEWSDDHHSGPPGTIRTNLWFNDEYLVVLEPREAYVLFITAYCTDHDHTVRKLEKRFESAMSAVPLKQTEAATGRPGDGFGNSSHGMVGELKRSIPGLTEKSNPHFGAGP